MKKARFWIGIAISIVALALAFRQVNFRAVWAALIGANYGFLLASLVPLVLFLVLRAFRWRLLFYPTKGLRVLNLFAVINIGYLLSNIFPARLGDVARAYLIGDSEDVSRAGAFSTIVAERVLDALCAVGGFFLVLPFVSLPEWMVRAGLIVGAAALIALVVFVILVRKRDFTFRLLDRVLSLLRWPDCETMSRVWERMAARTRVRFLANLPWVDRSGIERFVGSLIDGLSGITTLRLGPVLILWSVLIWAVISAFYWLVVLAFDPTQSYVSGVAVASVTALGMTVPASPGYIGVFEILARETLVLFGMQPELALGTALVGHAIVYLVYTVLGLISMAQQNLSYTDIQQRISAEENTAT